MADTEDADSQLLDKIDGKYGEVGDYDDLVNADEDALLEDDSDGLDIKHYGQTEFYNEDENDTDVLDLEAQDAELDDDLDEKNISSASNLLAVTSTTSNELDDSYLKETSGDEYNNRSTDKFKNERVISNNLPELQDEGANFKPNRNNRPFRGRNRGGKFANQRNNHFQKRNNNSNTVHINPHFKGQVKINNDARLAWDARHKINQKHQVGRVMPFNNQNNKNMIRPWSNNIVLNSQPFQNIQQVYPPTFQQQAPPPQQPLWNQYQPNNFNQVQIPNQQVQLTNQHMFMQPVVPPTQNIFTNNQPPNQFNQAIQQFSSPMYPTQNINPVFPNTQYVQQQQQQPNQFSIQMDPYVPRFQPNQPPPGFNHNNQFVPLPNQQPVQFNNPPQQKPFQNPPRFVKPKNTMFNQNKQFNKGSPPKRRLEGIVDIKKRKRSVSTGNLHEVKTVETPDTTVVEERQMEDEDEETRLYRKKIEEQKLLRQRVLAEKEKRRQQSITEENASADSKPVDLVTTVTQNIAQPQNQNVKRNLQVVRINQQNRNVPSVSFVPNKFFKNMAGKKLNTVQNSNIRVINTVNDESNYDKQHLASFLSNRKIIAKDQSLVDTSIVVVSNLAAGTTDVKLRKLCQGIGDVKKLQMSPKERQATIQFNSVASAHEFFKKYQRSMLDLSMIQVALKPMT